MALADLLSWEATEVNLAPDCSQARDLLRTARERAVDAWDYGVDRRLDDLENAAFSGG